MKKNVNNLMLLSMRSIKDRYNDQEREDADWDRVGVYDTKEKIVERVKNDAKAIEGLAELNGYTMTDDGCGLITVDYDNSSVSLDFCYEVLGDLEVNI